MKLSSAMKRAYERGYLEGPDWFCDFSQSEVEGLGCDDGVDRRDPSRVIKIGDTYYVYYSRSEGISMREKAGLEDKCVPWDKCEIWYATSKDTYNWEEKAMVVTMGEKGSYDDRSVFTPEILAYDGKYYLVYQVCDGPYKLPHHESIAMAVSDKPEGPFIKSATPVVEPSKDGVWEENPQTYADVAKKGGFDSLNVHDPILFEFHGKFHLYYKGEVMGEELAMGGRETKWGVAIADDIMGPYVKSEYNPVSNSGHETCLWKYNGGMAAYLNLDGPEKNTIQFAEDGINFEIKSVIAAEPPKAMGPYMDGESITDCLEGVKWGLCHHWKNGYTYIRRFDRNDSQKEGFEARKKGKK
ncbi:MAG: family 43 glycosylhydrolase [Lachnospiraceae bacterium]